MGGWGGIVLFVSNQSTIAFTTMYPIWFAARYREVNVVLSINEDAIDLAHISLMSFRDSRN